MSQKSELWSLVPAGDVNDQSWRARINLWGESTGLQGRESPPEHFCKIPQTLQYSSLILRAKFIISKTTIYQKKINCNFSIFRYQSRLFKSWGMRWILNDGQIMTPNSDGPKQQWSFIPERAIVRENDKIRRVLRTVRSGWEAYCALSSPLCQLQLWNRFFQNNPSAEESWDHHGLGQTQKWQTFWLSL